MDLWVMIVDGKVETRVFKKSEPIYIDPKSNHSRDEDFDKAVLEYSKAFAVSGHNYRRGKRQNTLIEKNF